MEGVVETDTTQPEVFTVIEEPAEFPEGINAMMFFIKKHLVIPNKTINGKIFVKFSVFEDGSINNITLIKGIPSCPECSEEAMRVVAIMPYWKPAKMRGKAVKCYFNLPISFKVP